MKRGKGKAEISKSLTTRTFRKARRRCLDTQLGLWVQRGSECAGAFLSVAKGGEVNFAGTLTTTTLAVHTKPCPHTSGYKQEALYSQFTDPLPFFSTPNRSSFGA